MRRLRVLVVQWVGLSAPPAEHADDRAGGRDRHRDVRRDLLGGHLRPQIPLPEALLEESIAPHPRLGSLEAVPVLFPIVMFVLPSNVRVHMVKSICGDSVIRDEIDVFATRRGHKM